MPTWTKEQLDAIETSGSNIIVSAGAGSGKTAVLTNRVIEKLKKGIHINELLILTFTKAAALEMKERIRKAIKKDKQLHHELDLIDSAYITTFDSFSLAVVSKYHYCLNLNKNINISDSIIVTIHKKEILDSLFEEYYGLDNPLFNKLIEDFCTKDDQELKKLILNIANKIELLIDKESFLNSYIENYFNDTKIAGLLDEYQKLICSKVDDIKTELQNFSYYVDKDYYNKVSMSLIPIFTCDDIEKIVYLDIKIPPVPKNSDEEVKNAKDLLKKKVDELFKFKNYGTLEEIKENVLMSKDTIKIIIEILEKYFHNLTMYKSENEIFEFQDIALLAIKILESKPAIKEELKDTFKEIMIDEYQDTNDIQEKFISLISNNNVYMVGDIKQSIYRFRNANPYIFKNKYDQYANNINGIKIDLLKNFRSRQEVLNNINKIFNSVMDDELGGADYISTHQMVFGNNTYIEEGLTKQNYDMELLQYPLSKDYSKDEIEIFTIGQDILNKVNSNYQIFDKDSKTIHNANFNDFVILMDRSTKFNLYKKIFEYLGIPLTIYQDANLNNSNDLYIIKNIIDLIIHINDNNYDTAFKYDFISIARSYLYRLPDNEIFTYFLNNNFKDSTLFKDMLEISKNTTFKTPHQILDIILDKTKFYEKITSLNDIDNTELRIQKLFEIIDNLSNIGFDIEELNSYLKTLIEENYDLKYGMTIKDNNSVRIMTIHKSKGLEFNICYFSGLDKSFNISDIKDKFVFDNKYGLIVPIFKEGIRENITKELLRYHYLEEEISEKIRLFYVALTRAKEKIIFIIPNKDINTMVKNEEGTISNSIRRKYKSFYDIITSIYPLLKPYVKEVDIKDLKISKDYAYPKKSNINKKSNEIINVEEINILNEEIINDSFSKKINDLITKEDSDNIKFGLEIHEVLELIDFKKPNYDLISNSFIINKVKCFLSSNIMQNIKDAKIYKEHEFIYTSDNETHHGIIDLMLEYDDHIDIIDYKLNNILDDKYIAQLNGYKDYIYKLTKKKVNIYLYSIIQEMVKEIM